ncbi:BhlA holin family protein [Clostridium intestinale DSM 6191]|uniref:BhlA holin family protein n=1 Tax=Clostridium intestinale DSM 6191 TaxID=1121320 RepID=A0A1M6A4L3_9CLOT|nr:BhlA holin family protein [Clostridium intestinale DSM 6191]
MQLLLIYSRKEVFIIEAELIKLIATQGAFALLFSYLLFYVLKENSKREQNYQEIIQKFSDSLPQIENSISYIHEMIVKKETK